MSDQGVLLAGLDGSNPLAFLAALGTLRTLTDALPDRPVRMAWEQADGAWRPRLSPFGRDGEVLEAIERQLGQRCGHAAFDIGDNLNVQRESFARAMSDTAAQIVSEEGGDRAAADFLAALGTDARFDDKGVIEDTGLRTMSGAGHQHFLKFMRDLCDRTRVDDLRRSLFATWDYADSGRGLSLRWDPTDDRRYALRWQNPSNDPNTTMRGANRLAIEALPLLTVVPTSHGAGTTCFTGRGARDTYFSWPIWLPVISCDVVRSLLGRLPLLVEQPAMRRALGVVAVFQSQRITVGKFRNFTPARAI